MGKTMLWILSMCLIATACAQPSKEPPRPEMDLSKFLTTPHEWQIPSPMPKTVNILDGL
jgi:hypothetical protein